LGFVNKYNTLVRLVDDFLLITTQKDEAQRFLNTMVGGHPEYGAFVSPHKTLTNFETGITGVRTISTNWFPFCGINIHTHNLGVSIDMSRIKDHAPTVEYSRTPFKTLSKT
jgi:telomerase reverse transcriptase